MAIRQFESFPASSAQISEERDFKNPVVRFRRINGRIVPIFNKQKIGAKISKGSDRVLAAGAGLVTLGLAKKLTKKLKFNPGSFSAGKLAPKSGSAVARAISVGSSPIKFAFRRPMAAGAWALGLGVFGKLYGTELQARSSLGYDIGADE